MEINKDQISAFDERRNFVIPGNKEETVLFCVRQFLEIGQHSIKQQGVFTVALSGGHTPHAIFQMLAQPKYRNFIDWSKILCFWSDERSAPPNSSENNFFSAMESGLSQLPLLPENIFRMQAEDNIEENALAYENLIREKVPHCSFDLVMLGMGEDGHTASLFPNTSGLHITNRLVIANYVPQKNQWRMTLTYECIHKAKNICIYVLGNNKAEMVKKVLTEEIDFDLLPIQKIGTVQNKSLWILDSEAGKKVE